MELSSLFKICTTLVELDAKNISAKLYQSLLRGYEGMMFKAIVVTHTDRRKTDIRQSEKLTMSAILAQVS